MTALLPWWVWAAVGVAGIVRIETLNRAGAGHFGQTLALTWPWILLSQLGLFGCWRHAPSLMLAWATFTLLNTAARLGVTVWAVGEPLTPYHILGAGLILAGAFAIKAA